MNDNSVIEKIKSGSREDLEQVYERYRIEFVSWITKNYSCSLEEAMDVYQFSVLILYENIVSGKLQHLSSSLKTYLFAIGKNKMLEFKKSSNRMISGVNDDMFYVPGESKEEAEAYEQNLKLVETCLDDLGEPCRTILEAYYYHKSSMEDIASKMDYKNAETVKNLKYKCMKRLKKIFMSRHSGQTSNT